MTTVLNTQLRDFITTNFLFGEVARTPADEEDLLLAGVIDSTGILELIEYLESEFGIQVTESETVPDNLGSIANLARYVAGKTAGQA